MSSKKGLNKIEFIVGIDEVGRGPLAGPVTLGAVFIGKRLYFKMLKDGSFSGLRDSKKLSKTKKEGWKRKIVLWKKEGILNYAIASSTSVTIDSKGLSFSISRALLQCLTLLNADPEKTLILLDGGLKASSHFSHQKTIIKGDESEPVISLASIMAKTWRDNAMFLLSKKYSLYEFEFHKGYGTKRHIALIKKHGLTPIHRRSFLTKLIKA